MAYDMGALWVFTKKSNLHFVASELYRILKPGGVYGCFEYLLTPHLEPQNPEHKGQHSPSDIAVDL